MWNDSEPGSDFSRFRDLYPVQVFYYFDGPKTFTFRDEGGSLYLAYFSQELGNIDRYIVSYISDKTEEDLQCGRISVRGVFTSIIHPCASVIDNVWVLDRDRDSEGIIVRAWKVPKKHLPQDLLPPLRSSTAP